MCVCNGESFHERKSGNVLAMSATCAARTRQTSRPSISVIHSRIALRASACQARLG